VAGLTGEEVAMFKKSILVQSVLMTMIAPSAVLAEVEATVEIRNETAVYINEGQTIGRHHPRWTLAIRIALVN